MPPGFGPSPAGRSSALISSGDPGDLRNGGSGDRGRCGREFQVPVEIVPGITAAHAAAAQLGAPLMLDYAAISLSDLLVPWKRSTRLEAVASADLVVALYNPRSKRADGKWRKPRRFSVDTAPGIRRWASARLWARRRNRSSIRISIVFWRKKSVCGAWL